MPAGRPPIIKSPEELQEKIDQYFAEKVGAEIVYDDNGHAVTNQQGNPVYNVRPPTVSGLALYLGFESRQSLYDYGKKPEYSYPIKAATLRIEEFAEKQLFTNAKATGAIFWLKNKGWKDKHEVDNTHHLTINRKTYKSK